MKKFLIAFGIIFAMNALQAMKESNVIDGNMYIPLSHQVYAGKNKLQEPTSISHLLDHYRVKPNEPLQKVSIWKKDYSQLYDFQLKGKKILSYLPLSLLQNLKEGEQLEITVDHQKFKLIVNQVEAKTKCPELMHLPNCDKFEYVLAYFKREFIQDPLWLEWNSGSDVHSNASREELLKLGILAKNAFGQITHGPNGWPEAQTLSTKVKRNAGKLSLLGLTTLAAGYTWWKGHIETSSIFSSVTQWASRFFPIKS